ncbi:MAG: GTP 3',8-cyclase MoaA [Desulfonatronovibrionaceae bacterium]
MIKDNFGRAISYLRLSVTDRCNLRCFYCRPCVKTSFISHDRILTYEDMLYLLQTVAETGVTKVRLTGGEPFARKDLLYFLARIKNDMPHLDLRLTTNATLISKKIRALKDIGIKGLNISLDTLDRDKYMRITGRDFLDTVMSNIYACLEHGLRVKINVVAMKGINDDELPRFVEMALARPVDVRFIEFMPIGLKTLWNRDYFWSAGDIVQAINQVSSIRPLFETGQNHGPARLFEFENAAGRIGVISPLSNHFCDTCNRLRVTADGRLRTCLFSDKDYRLLPLIRSPRLGKSQLKKVLARAGRKKPKGNEIVQEQTGAGKSFCSRIMSSIGG